MPDPSPDTPNAYAPRCGHHGNPLVWLDPALRWRCPHCFPELFPAARPAARSSSPDVTALADELRNAILDIDAHATPFGTDDDGFVSGGYLISVGSLHRALGVVGHSAAKCGGCRNCWTLDQWKAEEQLLRDELEAQATRITELERWKAQQLTTAELADRLLAIAEALNLEVSLVSVARATTSGQSPSRRTASSRTSDRSL